MYHDGHAKVSIHKFKSSIWVQMEMIFFLSEDWKCYIKAVITFLEFIKQMFLAD